MNWENTNILEKKKCKGCGFNKRLSHFYFYKKQGTYWGKCKKCVISYTLERRSVVGSKAWYLKRYNKIKENALKRNVLFDLTLEDFVTLRKKSCYYCGYKPEIISIDKVDPSGGYTLKNCAPACMACNLLKSGASVNICRKVIEFIDNK